MPAHLAQVVPKLAQGAADHSLPGRRRIALVHEQQQRHGEGGPPDAHHEKGDAHGLARPGQAEQLRLHHHDHAQGEEQTAAEIAQGITERRNPVQLGLLGHVHQQRIIGHDAAGKADDAQRIAEQRQRPQAGAHQKQRRGHERTEKGEQHQHPLLVAALVRQRADERRQHDHQGAGRRVAHPQPEGAVGGIQAACPILLEEDRKEAGHHRGGESGVAPVVERPGEPATSVQFFIPTPL